MSLENKSQSNIAVVCGKVINFDNVDFMEVGKCNRNTPTPHNGKFCVTFYFNGCDKRLHIPKKEDETENDFKNRIWDEIKPITKQK
jgi:hypothetical protein